MPRIDVPTLRQSTPEEQAVAMALATGEHVALTAMRYDELQHQVRRLFDFLIAAGVQVQMQLSSRQLVVMHRRAPLPGTNAGVLRWFTDEDLRSRPFSVQGFRFGVVWNLGTSMEARDMLRAHLEPEGYEV